MSSRNNQYDYRLATPEDGAEILNVYESGDFKGNISVLYTRRPDAYVSLMNDGENAVIPVMQLKDTGKIIAAGCCVIRKAYVNGEVKNVGYLTGLKVLPEYRNRMPYIKEVYQYLNEITKNQVDLYYTTILKENIEAQKILEKKRKNMPEYRYHGDYTVYCFKTGTKQKQNDFVLQKGNTEGLKVFYENHLKNYNLSPIDMDLHGITDKDIYTLRDSKGEIMAACVLWNQQSYKQYIITGYGGIYQYIKKLPLNWFGYPNLPKENTVANYASCTLLIVKDNDPKLGDYFIKKVAEGAAQYDFLMIGMYENHPLSAIFHKIKHVKYQSKLYTVHWDEDGLELDNRAIGLEVGLL